jgi:hypothetical protein
VTGDIVAVDRERAYFLFEARQLEGGHELDDWLQAEAQVSATARQSV